ncbi:helicase-related protein [Blastococcus haudaquaticus]|uniref:ATP-dependent RNA helicase SUPV3L1/SUV3 n=1 Tax=Blastococcus haudaquaticus TaxID=1938745 RepID=A0A286GXQ4_9ACTN|nr:helicase-related protein [Blastococcus haudaquaticus]SOE00288.1 ATP-dependent RNA helicase SUPV3L1/SUV3 [Blastococcus haudaquaticus]
MSVPPQFPDRQHPDRQHSDPRRPDRRRKRNVARDLRVRDDDRAAARVETLAQQSWVDGAEPELPVRTTRPENVVFHLGPTNSGKTYESLVALAENRSGVYAAPLRQLAHEAYTRLSAQLPPGTVGLSTGEEEIDPDAPIVCCTVEKAPMRGDLLVLDESHWVADPDRGHHWARLVLTGDYREMHLISAAEAYLLLKPLVADAKKITVVNHKRLSRLDVLKAPVRADGVRPQTLVVAFSRKAVYGVAAALDPYRPGKVGVLYGALPPATRRDVIDRFTRGETEVLVTTDVIGHGINVPATTVLFAETTKFDGVERRALRTWETAQIAGRAGRYGLTGHGAVGVLAGVTGMRADAGLLKAGAEVARGDAMSDLPKRRPRLRPELDDLGAFEPVDLPEALTRWMAWAREATKDQGAAMTADDVTSLIVRVHALLPLLRGPLGAAGDLWTVWRLINLPIDYNPPRRTRWLVLAKAALRHAAGLAVDPESVLEPMPAKGMVEDYEQAAAAARDAQTLLRSFPGVAGLTSEDAADVEDACADRITELLPEAIGLSSSGRCTSCGAGIAPWFSTCRDCSVGSAGRGPGRERTGHHTGDRHHDGHDRHPRQSRSGGGRAAASEGGRRGRGAAPTTRGRPGTGRSGRAR